MQFLKANEYTAGGIAIPIDLANEVMPSCEHEQSSMRERLFSMVFV